MEKLRKRNWYSSDDSLVDYKRCKADDSLFKNSIDIETSTPILDCSNSFIVDEFKECTINHVSKSPLQETPVDQIIPMKEFVKLTCAYVNKSQEDKENVCGNSLSSNQSLSESLNLDDSLDLIKKSKYMPVQSTPKHDTETPVSFIKNILNPEIQFASPCKRPILRRTKTTPLFNAIIESPILFHSSKGSLPVTSISAPEIYDWTNDCDEQIFNKIDTMSVSEVSEIIKNDFTSDCCKYTIIDCRYPYEYDGGHIIGAVNLYTPWQLMNYIFKGNQNQEDLQQIISDPEKALKQLFEEVLQYKFDPSRPKEGFIFHCEFSSIRGPKLAETLRAIDRILNVQSYPDLYIPEVYVLEKGYKEFYSKYKHLCVPQSYIKMEDWNFNCSFRGLDNSYDKCLYRQEIERYGKQVQSQTKITHWLIAKRYGEKKKKENL